VTLNTWLTLDLSINNPFAQPPLPLLSYEEEDLMGIDLLGDYVFYADSEDSDHESYPIPVSVYLPLPEMEARGHSFDNEVDMTDSNQFDDSEIGLDELMSDL